MKFSLLVFFWVTSLLVTFTDSTLTVEITNIKSAKGTIKIGIFKKGTKLTSKPDYPYVLALNGQGTEHVVFRLPSGRYACAAYHDVNNNDELDKNLFGYPKEAFGFSNDFRPVLSAPNFEDCAFEVKQGGTTIKVKLK